MPRIRLFSTLVLCGLLAGCGGSGEAVDGHGDQPATVSSGHGTPEDGGDEDTYVEPLVPPIDLGVANGGFIRTVGGGGLVDPLDLPLVRDPDFTADDRASFHAHGEEVCASGCAASRHPTPDLPEDEYRRLLLEFTRGPIDETNDALEALVFYGRQTTGWLDGVGPGSLSRERETFLREELKRTHALISFRIVDEHGVVRTHMPPTRVPFDRRHVFEMETENLPPLETSGTVKRVGLHHLWTRL